MGAFGCRRSRRGRGMAAGCLAVLLCGLADLSAQAEWAVDRSMTKGSPVLHGVWLDGGPVDWRLWQAQGNASSRIVASGRIHDGAGISGFDVPIPGGDLGSVCLLEWSSEGGEWKTLGPIGLSSGSDERGIPRRGVASPAGSDPEPAGMPDPGFPWLSLYTTATGLHRVDAAQVGAWSGHTASEVAGWMRAGVLHARVGGRLLPWRVASDGSHAILFVPPQRSVYSVGQAVQLFGGPAPALESVSAAPQPSGVTTRQAWVRRDREEDLLMVSTAPGPVDEEFWFWQNLLPGHPVLGRRIYEVVLGPTGAASVDSRLELDVVSTSEASHHLRVSWNDQVVGELSWIGRSRPAGRWDLPASVTRSGTNRLVLESIGDRTSLTYLDRFSVTHREEVNGAGTGVVVQTAAAGNLEVPGWLQPQVEVWDVTDPWNPVHLREARWTSIDGQRGNLEFAVAADRQIECASLETLPRFASARRIRPLTPWEQGSAGGGTGGGLRGADWLAVVPAAWEAELEPLLSWRRQQGLSAMVVTLESVWDAFSAGRPDPRSLMDLVKAADRWDRVPRFVVLVGDGTLDYRDGLRRGDQWMPPLMVKTPLGRFAADTLLAEADEPGRWRRAVGRIPVRSVAELRAWIGKSIRTETASRQRPVPATYLLMAGEPDGAGEFIQDSHFLRGLIPAGHPVFPVEDATGDLEGTRKFLLEMLGKEPAIWNYVGHGARDRLGNGYMLVGDMPALPVTQDPPFLAAMTCGAGDFAVPGFQSVSEALLLHGSGGVCAVWSPAGFSFNASARLLNQALFSLMADSGRSARLGDLLVQTIGRYRQTSGDRLLPQLYNFLGDPATPLRLLPGGDWRPPTLSIRPLTPSRVVVEWADGEDGMVLVEGTEDLGSAEWKVLGHTTERRWEVDRIPGKAGYLRVRRAVD